ncbi:MAG TPA: hypothetical protein VE863_12065 [Pyrinomonadaceae bacterium]|jgi:hypothetical protein|nr:hypothetical protein [Pyrinomonadaceae bacterium]
MFGSSILDVAIGMIFVYLFLSLICTAVNEGIATLFNKRGANLFDGVKNLLNDPKFTGLSQQLYTHGLVDGISREASDPKKANRLPSYMPSNTFALALLDILGAKGAPTIWLEKIKERQGELTNAQTRLAANPSDIGLMKAVAEAQTALDLFKGLEQEAQAAVDAHTTAAQAANNITGPKDKKLTEVSGKLETALALGRRFMAAYPDPMGSIQKAVEDLPSGHTRESLLVIIDKSKRESALIGREVNNAEQQIEVFKDNVEQWFNDTMDRVGGWYKRWTQKILLAIAIVVVIAGNVDSFMLAKRFLRDTTLRASVVSAAEKAVSSANPTQSDSSRDALLKTAQSTKLPFGWTSDPNDPFYSDQIPNNAGNWILKIVGLFISIFAVSLGAPFWFDTLSKFINVRAAGTPPGEQKKSAGKTVDET